MPKFEARPATEFYVSTNGHVVITQDQSGVSQDIILDPQLSGALLEWLPDALIDARELWTLDQESQEEHPDSGIVSA